MCNRSSVGLVAAFSALLLPFLAFSSTQNSPESGGYRISTDVVMVLLDASVKNSHGGYATGLSQDDFHVYENGDLQKITSFDNGDVPVAVGLVMDDSGSVGPKRNELVTAGLAFAGASNPRDQIFVVNFNDKVRSSLPENVPFTDNLSLLRTALLKNRPEGMTALYDAIAFSLGHLEKGQRDKKALVVVSDGGDNCSTHSFAQLMQIIEESQTTIYTVGIYDSYDPDRNPGVLKQIAKVSGGECFLPGDYKEVVPICKGIAKDIRNRYTIGYIPEHTGEKAGLRKIRVTASAPDRGNLKVRTRMSYIVPEGLK